MCANQVFVNTGHSPPNSNIDSDSHAKENNPGVVDPLFGYDPNVIILVLQ